MPRAAWDLVWERMPALLRQAQSTNEIKGQAGRRHLAGPLLASVVVEELVGLCGEEEVRRGSASLAGERSLVSAHNLSALITLVGAATSDFRGSGSNAPASGECEGGAAPESRAQQATRLYSLLVQAAGERRDLGAATELWLQVVWSLVQHLPARWSHLPVWAAGVEVTR
jgi:hypothetical protein